jgi:hypothetical protein
MTHAGAIPVAPRTFRRSEQCNFRVEEKMRHTIYAAGIGALLLGGASASLAQTAVFNFEDNTDQGFGTGFGNDASKTFTIVNIGGSNRMLVPDTASFQEAGRESGNPADPMYQAMLAASSNEAGYELSYDWYVDTSQFGGGGGTFMQLGTYVNTGNGYYAQDFPGTGKDVELNGTQLASGQVFSGTVAETFAAKGFDLPDAQTFFRFGVVINGNGTTAAVHFDNFIIRPVPEPASAALLSLLLPALSRRPRRRS